MCPDDQILSAYYDGEVPAPWDGKIEEHLNQCSDCRQKIEMFNSITLNLKNPESVLNREMARSLDRVYNRIQEDSLRYHPHLWQRKVRIPVPFLAAAAAIALFFGIGYFTGRGQVETQSAIPVAQETADILTVQLDEGDMTDLAEFLKNRDEQVQVFIELPPASFIGAGDEPQLIRAADYRP